MAVRWNLAGSSAVPDSLHLIDFGLDLRQPFELRVELAAGVGHRVTQALEFSALHVPRAASR